MAKHVENPSLRSAARYRYLVAAHRRTIRAAFAWALRTADGSPWSIRRRSRRTHVSLTGSRRLQLTPEQGEQQEDGKRNAQEPQQGASAKCHC
jgi:hypothetical protein